MVKLPSGEISGEIAGGEIARGKVSGLHYVYGYAY